MNVCPNAAWIVNAVIYGVLTAIGLLGVVVLMFIRSTPSKPERKKEVSSAENYLKVFRQKKPHSYAYFKHVLL